MNTPELAELVMVCVMAWIGLSSVRLVEERIGRWAGTVTVYAAVLSVLATEVRLVAASVIRFVNWLS